MSVDAEDRAGDGSAQRAPRAEVRAPVAQPSAPNANHPLRGVRVIDATTTFAGPYGTTILAELGAEVIKIEAPPDGDITRMLTTGRSRGMSGVFVHMNQGKRSVAIDLKSPASHAIMERLLGSADVFVHNMRPSAARRLGLGYEDLQARHPSLIYCNLCGFGQDGRYADKPAYDDIIQAMSGLAAVQGFPDHDPEYVHSVVADKTLGLTLVYALLAALFARERTGTGQRVEVPMYETMVSYVLVEHMGGLTFEPADGSPMYARAVSPYRRPYRTLDGFIGVLVYTDAQWHRFLRLIQREDLEADPKFATPNGRIANIDEVYSFVEQVIASDTTDSWIERLERADIPVGPVNRVADLIDDPHLDDVGLFSVFEHETDGPIRVVRPTVQFGDERPSPVGRGAPRYGRDTFDVLCDLGYSDAEITELVDTGVVFEAVRSPD
ncbi:MAG: acetyl-CoA acetyltransferase [Actinomycetia bacterium]|nr:acetyl-CoA acetyltransferase [Actinomycetes bacterium]